METLHIFLYLSFFPCSVQRDAKNAFSPALCGSPLFSSLPQARLVAVSRLFQRCLGVLLWAGSWDFALLPGSGGFICIIRCCLGRLSRCFCNQPHVSQGWDKSKSWEYLHLPAEDVGTSEGEAQRCCLPLAILLVSKF